MVLAMHRALRDRDAWVTRLMGQPVRLRVGLRVFEDLGAVWHAARVDEALARAGAVSSSE